MRWPGNGPFFFDMTKTARYTWPWPSRNLTMIGILLVGSAILCAVGCFQFAFIHPKPILPIKCSPAYPPFIGEYLKVGASAERILQEVGKPNLAWKIGGLVYYVYFIEPYTTWGFSHVCYSKPNENSSLYYVTFDADRRVESVMHYMLAGAASQQVKVPGAEGLMLPANLYSPRGCSTERKPALVLLHGWLDEGATDTELGNSANLFAEQGYVVLVPLMRGWGGGQNDCGLSQPADTTRMIEWLASQPGVDPDRIGIVGFSFGGQVALLTGALSHRVKAIVSYDGPTDVIGWNSLSYWPDWLKPCRGLDFKKVSPVTVASQIKAPVLLIQGDSDTNVLPEQAEEMEQAMWKSGGNVQLYLVSGVGHSSGLSIGAFSVAQQFLEANLGKPSCVQTLHAPSPSPQPN
jgi:dienelactone hydrolase